LENGGIEGEPGLGVQNVEESTGRPVMSTLCIVWLQNVEKSAGRPRMSTFCALYAQNVEVGRWGAENSTFCAPSRAPPQCKPFNGAGAPTT
jgi:hypothetical protein